MASNFYSQIFEQFFFIVFFTWKVSDWEATQHAQARRHDMKKQKQYLLEKKLALYGAYFKYITAILATFREKKSSKDQELDKNLYCIPLSMN